MKKILIYSLFPVFLASNITKWYISVGDIRIYYAHLALLCWFSMAIPCMLRLGFRIPRGIKTLMLLKYIYIAVVLLAIPSIFSEVGRPEFYTYIKGILVTGFEGLSIILMLVFATQLKTGERNTVVNLYLASITICIGYTFLQALAIYGHGVDLDIVVASHLPFWNGQTPGIAREVFGLASGTYYRFNGFAGDPNLNGMTFLVATPIVFLRAVEKRSLLLGALFLVFVGTIVLTVSNTAILLTLPVLLLLSLKYWQRSRWVVITMGCVFAALGIIFTVRYGADFKETLQWKFKLAEGGTASSHLDIGREALSIWFHHPLGIGINSYPRYSSSYSAHDSYLQTLVELGPLGLAACIGWVLYCLVKCSQARENIGFVTALSVGALALGAVGHDLLNRFEFQLAINLLVAFVILNHQDRIRRNAVSPMYADEPVGLSSRPT